MGPTTAAADEEPDHLDEQAGRPVALNDELQQNADDISELPRNAFSHAFDTEVAMGSSPMPPLVSILRVLFFIGCWYCISITITLYNKWLFSVYDFHFPLLVTSLHIAFKVPASRLLMYCLGMPPVRFGSWRVIALEVAPSGLAMTGDIAMSNLSFLYTTVTYYTIVKSSVPLWIMLFSAMYGLLRMRAELIVVLLFIAGGISLASVHLEGEEGDHGSSMAPPTMNASLPLGIGFEIRTVDTRRALADLAVISSGLRHPWRCLTRRCLSAAATAAALGNSSGGVDSIEGTDGAAGGGGSGHASGGSNLTSSPPSPPPDAGSRPASSDLVGGLLVLGASMCAGFRWACTQVLMAPRESSDLGNVRMLDEAPRALLNPVTLLYYTSPFGLAGLLPLALVREASDLGDYMAVSSEGPTITCLVMVGAFLGFALLLTELKVVQLASALTLSVAGIFKELLTVLASTWLLGDQLTSTNVAGLCLCLVGIGLYNRSQMLELHRLHDRAPVQIDR